METYNYNTYQISMSETTRANFSNHLKNYLNPIGLYNMEIFDNAIPKIKYNPEGSHFKGNHELIQCLKMVAKMTEMFGEYLTDGLSTNKIIKQRSECVSNLYSVNVKLIQNIKRIADRSQSDEEKRELNELASMFNLGQENNVLI